MQEDRGKSRLFVLKMNLPFTVADGGLAIVSQDTLINSCDGSTLNHKKQQIKRSFLLLFV